MSTRVFLLAVWLCVPFVVQAQEMKCTASDGAEGDRFGQFVGIDGDHMIVGAMYDDDAGATTGSAYIYDRNEGGADNWGEVRKLTASDAAATSYFGQEVAVNGDHAIVGAPFAYGTSGTIRRGAAYVFQRDRGGVDQWGEVKKLNTHTGTVNGFGWSVDIDGDYAIVGDYYDDTIGGFGSGCGSAHLFKRNIGGADNWGEAGTIFPSCFTGSHFGESVAISGEHLIIGAAAWYAEIWHRDSSDPEVWSKARTLTSGAADDFAHAIDISGDYAVVGAYRDDDLGTSAGAVYIYYRNEGGSDNWGQVTKITGSDVAADDRFGYSVTIEGDYVTVGAPGDDDLSTDSGALYVFYRNQGGPDEWGEVAKITSSDGAEGDQFGYSVASNGDHIVSSAPNDDDNGAESGSAYMYDWNTVLPVELLAFDAVVDGSRVLLRWTTASEAGNAGFDVQHKTSSIGLWGSIAFVDGHGTTDEGHTYALRTEPLAPGEHQFRLRQIDLDGEASYSGELSVHLVPARFRLHQIYPNPVNPTTTIRFDLPGPGHVRLTLADVLGRHVRELASGDRPAGTYEVSFDVTDLPSGIYLCRFQVENHVETKRMVVVK